MQRLSTKGTMVMLVRHGERVTWHLETQKDTNEASLTEKGKHQALQAALALQSVPLAALYSSPYQRCLQTAHLICERQRPPISLVIEPDLREWEILPSLRGHPTRTAWKYLCRSVEWLRPPEGEAIEDLAWRGARLCERLAHHHQGQAIALCGHKALFRTTCQKLIWAPALVKDQLEMPEGCILRLWREQDGRWIVLSHQSWEVKKNSQETRQQ